MKTEWVVKARRRNRRREEDKQQEKGSIVSSALCTVQAIAWFGMEKKSYPLSSTLWNFSEGGTHHT